jgi:hypothetical protein
MTNDFFANLIGWNSFKNESPTKKSWEEIVTPSTCNLSLKNTAKFGSSSILEKALFLFL